MTLRHSSANLPEEPRQERLFVNSMMAGLFGREGTEEQFQSFLDVLDSKNQHYNLELPGIWNKAEGSNHKEVEITDLEEKLRRKEEIIDDILDIVEEREKVVEAELKLSKKKEEFIKTEEKRLDLEKEEISSEKESLLVLKDELERVRDEINVKLLQIDDENEKLKVQKELLLKEEEGLKQERKQFVEEQEVLDEKKVAGTVADLMSSVQPRGCRRLSWLRNCTSRIFRLSRKTTKHSPELSPSDEKAIGKRTRYDDRACTEAEAEAEAERRKRRQIDIQQLETPLIDSSKYVLDRNDGGDDTNEKLIKGPGDCLDRNDNGDGDHHNVVNSNEKEEEEEEDNSEQPAGETSMSRKIWKFLTT